MQDCPDKPRDITKHIPKQAREISAFFSLLVDETMKTIPDTLTPTWIRCFGKGCTGTISSSVDLDENKQIFGNLNWILGKNIPELESYFFITFYTTNKKTTVIY